nr:hypothetical protein [Nonomuraea aurantiaca]
MTHPTAQRFAVHAELLGHSRDRAGRLAGLLTDLKDHPHRAFTELVGVLLGGWHRV